MSRGWGRRIGLLVFGIMLASGPVAAEPAGTTRVVAPGRRHVVQVKDGAVFLDGRRVHPRAGRVLLVGMPRFRSDGRALAWLERTGRSTRLVVLTDLRGAAPWPWALPATAVGDRLFWAGPQRIVVGPALLAPRAVATW